MVVSSAFAGAPAALAGEIRGAPASLVSASQELEPAHRPLPSPAQLAWLRRAIAAPGHKLPLFDRMGRGVPSRMIVACLRAGWAEAWFANPFRPDLPVCRLTAKGLETARLGRVERPFVRRFQNAPDVAGWRRTRTVSGSR